MIYVDSDEKDNSFESLCDKYYTPIYNYIFHKILNKENAEDITGNTFLKALNYIKKKNPKIDNFQAWIFKIATNEIFNFIKHNKDKKNISIEECNSQILDFIDKSFEKNMDEYCDFIILNNVIANMKHIEKTLLVLYYFEKKTYPEISVILNINENTLRPMMSRILKKLYKKLKNKIL